MKNFSVASMVVVLTGIIASLFVPSGAPAPVSPSHSFRVAVVGKGVPDPQHPSPRDDDSKIGADIYKGAQLASQGQVVFTLLPKDDGNNPEKARQIAKQLITDPTILAVVGHAASGATRAGSGIYESVRIPLLMPVATAQSVMFPEGVSLEAMEKSDARLDGVFRLPPGDDKAQAPAVAYLIAKKLFAQRVGKVHLVEGVKDDAEEYSTGLGRKIQSLLSAEPGQMIDRVQDTRTDLNLIVQGIHKEHDAKDVVVFMGYYPEAADFLKNLRAEYSDSTNVPALVFTDGAPLIEEDPSSKGLRIYRMGFANLNQCMLPSSPPPPPRSELSAEFTYGYDAISIIRQAVKICEGQVSRACLLNQIRNMDVFSGSCGWYSFRNGESILSSYYVFQSADAQGLGSTTPYEIRPDNMLTERSLVR